MARATPDLRLPSQVPSRKALPPWYQIILLGDSGTCVLTTCMARVALDSGEARIRTRDHEPVGGEPLMSAVPDCESSVLTTLPPSHTYAISYIIRPVVACSGKRRQSYQQSYLVPLRLNFFETQINVMRNCVKRKNYGRKSRTNLLLLLCAYVPPLCCNL